MTKETYVKWKALLENNKIHPIFKRVIERMVKQYEEQNKGTN